jgi:hypothetical protein
MKVSWVTGREKALAHAVAMHVVAEAGRDWDRLSPARREMFIRSAQDAVRAWNSLGVLARFDYDYAEAPPPIPDAIPPEDPC